MALYLFRSVVFKISIIVIFRILTLFWIIVDSVMFLIPVSLCSLLVYRNTTDFFLNAYIVFWDLHELTYYF